MPKERNKIRKKDNQVMLGIWVDPHLRDHGQAAVRILGYRDMTKFIESSLYDAIERAQKEFAGKPKEHA